MLSRTRVRSLRHSAAVLAALALAGCGAAQRSPARAAAAEPAGAPPVSAAPAGRSIRVGHMPEGIAVDPTTGIIAVGLRDPATLALIDARGGRVLRRIPIPGAPRHLQLAAPGGPVLVPAEGASELVQVSLPAGRITTTRVRTQPHDAAEVAGRIFVGNEFGDSVSVIGSGRVMATIGGLVQPGGVAAVGGDVAVIDVRSDLLSLYDAGSLALRGRIPAGSGPTHVVAGSSARVYVADTRGGALESFDVAPRLHLRARLALAGTPYGLALDRQRRRLWVTLTARNELVELSLDGSRPRRLAVFPTARQPNTVAVDPSDGRVFVADRLAGVVQVIDPRR